MNNLIIIPAVSSPDPAEPIHIIFIYLLVTNYRDSYKAELIDIPIVKKTNIFIKNKINPLFDVPAQVPQV